MRKNFLTVCGLSICMVAVLTGCGEEKNTETEVKTEAATEARTEEEKAEEVTETATEAGTEEEKTEAKTEAKTEEEKTESKDDNSSEAADNAPAPASDFYNFVSDPSSYSWEINGPVQSSDFKWDSFQLVDFDGDGTPELIATCVSEDRPDGGMQHYAIVDNTGNGLSISDIADGVASAGGYRGTAYYIPGTSIIYDLSNSAPTGAPGATIYAFENGKIEYKEGGYCEPDPEDPSDWSKGTWNWGTEEISEDEYNNKLNSLTQNQSGTPLNEINYMDKDSMLKELQK